MGSVLFFSRPRFEGWPHHGRTFSIISVLCHSDLLFYGECCPRIDVVNPGRTWTSSPVCTWHCSLHHISFSRQQSTPLLVRLRLYRCGYFSEVTYTDFHQTWTYIHLWLLFEKFGPKSPGVYPHRLEAKKTLFGTDFELWPKIYLQWNKTSTIGKKFANLQGIPYTPPKFDELWFRNGWERLASLCPPPYFSHWATLPALPYERYVTDSRQTLARVM